jgi:hypothetical protein
MFRLDPNPTFPLKVLLHLPGVEAPATLDLIAKHLGKTALKTWLDRASATTDAEFLAEVIRDWSGVFREGDMAVPFSRDALAQLLESFPAAGAAIVRAYLTELSEVRQKN